MKTYSLVTSKNNKKYYRRNAKQRKNKLRDALLREKENIRNPIKSRTIPLTQRGRKEIMDSDVGTYLSKRTGKVTEGTFKDSIRYLDNFDSAKPNFVNYIKKPDTSKLRKIKLVLKTRY